MLEEILSHLHSGQIQLAVNKQAHNGWSPLIVAASKGHTDICLVGWVGGWLGGAGRFDKK